MTSTTTPSGRANTAHPLGRYRAVIDRRGVGCGEHTVVIANNLGWPTADALAHEVNSLIPMNHAHN